jgi:hypothetical protein
MPTKMIHISNPNTITKLESLEAVLDMKSPKIVDKALDVYILSLTKEHMEKNANENMISTFITQAPINSNMSVVSKVVEVNSKVL